MSTEPPIILISPETKNDLETEAERTSATGDLVGGLLFGHSPDERHRIIVSFVRPRPETGFGKKEFCLDQSRTSQQLDRARELAAEAHYCGVWYVHRTPDQELTDEEWVQTQRVLEDPDFRFKDTVCLVICLYFGDLNIHALSFDLQQSARGQLPTPTQLQLTTDTAVLPSPVKPSQPSTPPADWYKFPDIARRLTLERKQLTQRYRVEPAVTPGGKVIFRLMPKRDHGDMVFYVACESGFPDQAPTAFLSLRGDRYPLLSPGLNEWSAERRLVEVADDLVEWQAHLFDQKIAAAEEAIERGDYQEASDLLVMVLLMNPRKPRAARLLGQVQAMLGEE